MNVFFLRLSWFSKRDFAAGEYEICARLQLSSSRLVFLGFGGFVVTFLWTLMVFLVVL